jgi:hypothetical protein
MLTLLLLEGLVEGCVRMRREEAATVAVRTVAAAVRRLDDCRRSSVERLMFFRPIISIIFSILLPPLFCIYSAGDATILSI